MWIGNWREQTWSELDQPWDIIVIGGGITGAGILREAARVSPTILDFPSTTYRRPFRLQPLPGC